MSFTNDEPINVLLIEDNPTDVRLVQEILRGTPNDHFTIISASTLAQGLDRLTSDHFDVILLDLGLPDSQGFGTFQAVEERASDLPIIILTISANEELGLKAIRAGAQRVFSKDVLTPDGAYAEMFPHVIHYAIEHKRVEAELQQQDEKVRRLNKELESKTKELRIANEALEQRVEERTEELREMKERLEVYSQQQTILNLIIAEGNRAPDLTAALRAMLDTAMKVADVDYGAVYLLNEAEGTIELQYTHGISEEVPNEVRRIPVTASYYPYVYEGTPLFFDDFAREGTEQFKELFPELHTAAIIPLIAQDRAIGHYFLGSSKVRGFADEEKTLLVAAGHQVGTVAARLQAEEQVKQYSQHLEDLVEERTAQLKDAERLAAIGQTATMIGHDLRNPLQALQFSLELEHKYCDIISDDMPGDPRVAKAAGLFTAMEQQIQYMDKIVSDLQDYARPLKVEREEVHLTPFVTETLALLAIPEPISVNVNIPGSLIAWIDPHLMQRALSNLTMNAVQAMPEGGELTVSATKQDGTIAITIHDTGQGVPDNMKDTLFSPLTTGKAKGTGLGLAVVKRIIAAHDGTITFASEEGKGTTFIVTLPQMGE